MDPSPVVGLWLGFILSLMVFSQIFGDNLLSRVAQYILVGSATGYLMVLVIQDILRPKLIEPLFVSGPVAFDLLVPLLLGVGLVTAGLDGTLRQGRVPYSERRMSSTSAPKRSALSFQSVTSILYKMMIGLGRIALMVIVGVGIANAITGTIQGTLIPQFWQATRIGMNGALLQSAARQVGEVNAIGALVALFMTIAVMLHLYVVPYAFPASGKGQKSDEDGLTTPEDSSRLLTNVEPSSRERPFIDIVINNFFVRLWAAVGKRALWFAAGVLFARLAASRLSLLIARMEYFVETLETTALWRQLIRLIEPFFG